MEYLYDNHLDLIPIHNKEMRFKGEESLINYLAHVDNLVCKAILESLGSSTYKDASDFLDKVRSHGWKNITMLLVLGDIAVLRIIILWMNKSPQRIQEWLSREGVKKQILYDVDTRWNYTVVIIEVALENRAALQAWIKDQVEL